MSSGGERSSGKWPEETTGIALRREPELAGVIDEPRRIRRDIAQEIAEGRKSTCEVLRIEESEVLAGRWGDGAAVQRQIQRFFELLSQSELTSAAILRLRTDLHGYGAWLVRLTDVLHSPDPRQALAELARRERSERGFSVLANAAKVHLHDHHLEWAEHKKMHELALELGLPEEEIERAYAGAHPEPFTREPPPVAGVAPPRSSPPPDDPCWLIGETLHHKFVVQELCADGRSAVVYRGIDVDVRRQVAIKCLKLPVRLDPEHQERLLAILKEGARALAVAGAHTRSIVQVFDCSAIETKSGDWVPYVVLEWLEGHTLAAEMTERRARGEARMTLGEALDLLEGAAVGLSIAHRDGLVHGEVNPSNFFVVDEGREQLTKILDFWTSSAIQRELIRDRVVPYREELSVLARPYAAPEQLRRRAGTLGPWSDVFSLARLVCDLVTGAPSAPLTPEQVLAEVMNPATRPTPAYFEVHLGPEVEAVFQRALAVATEERYEDADRFWTALRVAAAPRPTLPPPSRAPSPAPRPPSLVVPSPRVPAVSSPARSLRRGAMVVTSLIALAGGGLSFRLITNDPEPPVNTALSALSTRVAELRARVGEFERRRRCEHLRGAHAGVVVRAPAGADSLPLAEAGPASARDFKPGDTFNIRPQKGKDGFVVADENGAHVPCTIVDPYQAPSSGRF